jgi:transposase
MWLARLTGLGLLRASFVPPTAIRDLRDYTRMRTRLVQERTRCFQRMEKLLESALVKVSSVASKLTTISAQDIIRAMAAGQRDPQVLASLARTAMRAKRAELAEALDGMFDEHHGELATMLLDQIAFLDQRIAALSARGAELTAAMPAARGINSDGTTGPDAGAEPDAAAPPAVTRPAEIPGISPGLARTIIAEIGLDMTRFPATAHLVSWAGLCPSARQPGSPAPAPGPGEKARATPGCAASSARPPTAPPAPRPSPASGTTGSCAAAAKPKPRSPSPAPPWPSSHWHLLKDPTARFTDLGPGYHQAHPNTDRKLNNHIRQIQTPASPSPSPRPPEPAPHLRPNRRPHQARPRCRAPISSNNFPVSCNSMTGAFRRALSVSSPT